MLKRLPRPTDPNLLVGFDTNDDAGVYRINPELALVQTVDFFTPIVDDPFVYGQIAAANALSDVYAMGGRPLSALSILGFPPKGDPVVMEQILRGGLERMNQAGCTVVGGHSIRDDDIKFGYAVTGLIHPDLIWRNVGARPGDLLLLTKPLGTGVIATALKSGSAAQDAVAASVASMTRLNKDAAEALREVDETPVADRPVHAVTDVTGFGLLGHAHEMAIGSGVSFEIEHARIEYLRGALEASRAGFLPGGLANNRDFVGSCAGFAESVPQEFRSLLFDPQTSGGLLVSLAAEAAPLAVAALDRRGVPVHVVGSVVAKTSPLLHVI